MSDELMLLLLVGYVVSLAVARREGYLSGKLEACNKAIKLLEEGDAGGN